MKKNIIFIVIFLLSASMVIAGLPPASSKIRRVLDATAPQTNKVIIDGGGNIGIYGSVYGESHSIYYQNVYYPLLLVEGFSEISDWTLTDSASEISIAESSIGYQLGRGCIRCTSTTDSAGQNAYITQNRHIDLSNQNGFWLIMYFPYRSQNITPGLTMYLSHSINLGSGVGRVSLTGIPSATTGGTCAVWIDNDDWSVLDGSPNFSNPWLSWRFRIDGNATDIRDWALDGIIVGKSKAKILITLDDGFDSAYTIGHVEARKRNIPLTHYIIASQLDQSGYMTTIQVQTLITDGDYIGLHGANSWGDNPDRIASDKTALLATGLSDCKHGAYPGGDVGWGEDWQITHAAMTAAGVLTGRMTSGGTVQLPRYSNLLGLLSYPLNNTMSLNEAKAVIDLAIDSGGTVIFYGHKFDSTADSVTWVTSDFQDLLDYIDSKRSSGLIDVVTIDDWYGDLKKI